MSPRRRKTESRFADAPLDGPLLEVEDVRTYFKTERGLVRAVDGVSLSLERGKTIGVVGESGSGKSVLSRSIMGLLPSNVERNGSIRFEGRELGSADTETMRAYWGTQMAMVDAFRAELAETRTRAPPSSCGGRLLRSSTLRTGPSDEIARSGSSSSRSACWA